MTILFFDTETIPAPEERIPLLKRLHGERLAREEAGGLSRTPEDFDAFYRRTSLSGAFGQVFCLAAIKESEGKVVLERVLTGNEVAILKSFWELAQDVHLFVGHGIRFFDVKFLMQRSIIQHLPFKAINTAKFRDSPVFDTMDQWTGYEGTVSLHELALALGLPSPKDTGLEGSQIYDFYLAGKHQEIYDYCLNDTRTARAIYQLIVKYKG